MKTPVRDRVMALTRQHESTAVNTFAQGDQPPLFVRGEGPFLETETGERFLDLIAGSAVTNLGHGLPAHREAIERALMTGITHTGTRFAHEDRAELYADLARILPDSLTRYHLISVGTEAVETAIKAAQYHTKRRRIFAFEGGYHGRTVGSLSVTYAAKLKKTFTTLEGIVTFIPFPYRFRDQRPQMPFEDLAAFCIDHLEQQLSKAKKADDLPACLILEAIQGTSGAIQPPPGFLRQVAALAAAYEVLLIVDEVWTGFGRTGRWFAFEHDGVVPDLVCLSKGLSAGLPLAAVASREDILGGWPAGIHTSTFQGNPIACAMARATLKEIETGGWIDHAAGPIASTFARHLQPLQALAWIRETRWIGAAAAIEFSDAEGKADPARRQAVQDRAFGEKLLIYGGGRYGNSLILLPPINIDIDVLDRALGSLAHIITALQPAG